MMFKSKAEGGKKLKAAHQELKVAIRTKNQQAIVLAKQRIKAIQNAIDDLDEIKFNRNR